LVFSFLFRAWAFFPLAMDTLCISSASFHLEFWVALLCIGTIEALIFRPGESTVQNEYHESIETRLGVHFFFFFFVLVTFVRKNNENILNALLCYMKRKYSISINLRLDSESRDHFCLWLCTALSPPRFPRTLTIVPIIIIINHPASYLIIFIIIKHGSISGPAQAGDQEYQTS